MEKQPNEIIKTEITPEYEDAAAHRALERAADDDQFQLTSGQRKTINNAAEHQVTSAESGVVVSQAAYRERAAHRSELITHAERFAEDPRALRRYTVFGNLVFRRIQITEPRENGIEREEK